MQSGNLSTHRIVFRADGGQQMGLGHLFRSMALAEMLIDAGFDCRFLLNNVEDHLAAVIGKTVPSEKFVAETVAEEISWLRRSLHSSDVLVMDGYRFNSEFQLAVKQLVYRTVCIDDLASGKFYTDVVLNHGNTDMRDVYQILPETLLLLGPRYAILRPEFRNAAQRHRQPIREIDTVFICMGGADPFNITNKILRAIKGIGFITDVNVVAGAAFAFEEELQQLVAELSLEKRVVVKRNIGAGEMIGTIESSQLAICPASSISLEILCARCGLLTGTVADNQLFVEAMLTGTGSAVSVGNFTTATVEELTEQIVAMNDLSLANEQLKRQEVTIDGLSADRLVDVFKKLVC